MKAPATPLGAFLELRRDVIKVDSNSEYEMAGVRSFGAGLFIREPLDGSTTSYRSLNRLAADTVVLSRLFGWEGALSLVPADFEGRHVSTEFPTFEIDSSVADPLFVRYLCTWPGLWERLATVARGVGVRRKRVHVEDFLNVEVPLPQLAAQHAIGTHLDAIAEHSAAALASVGAASNLYGSLVESLVHRPDLSEREKEQHGWRRRALHELVAHVDRREQVLDDAHYRVTGVYSFGRGLIDRGEIQGADTSYGHLTPLKLNDLVMSRLNGWEGALAIVDGHFAGSYVSNEYPVFEVDRDQVDLGFLSALVATPVFWKQLDDETRGSMVRRRRVHPRALLKIELWVPPRDYQAEISDQLVALRRMAQDEARREILEALVPSAVNDTFAALA